ncbi:MAG TPA: hypothetical protein VFA89_24555 [Terriglobales bacterium]|nr:hypothetical protein [Terriglobales bacterium]
MSGIELKIERANKHIDDLESLVSAFLGRDFYSLGIKPKPQIEHVAYYVTRVDPMPADISLVIGDALHNLRSSLDHLAWQLVEVSGGIPDKIDFPITKTRQQYDSAFGKREVTQIRPEILDLIRKIQPYRSTDDTLWHLHQLDIMDKHKLIVPIACALKCWGLKRENVWLSDLSGSYHIELGEELLNVPASTFANAAENIKFGTDIAFRDLEIVGSKSVLETLYKMSEFVSGIIDSFSQYLV